MRVNDGDVFAWPGNTDGTFSTGAADADDRQAPVVRVAVETRMLGTAAP